jgi:general secretion pathway protein G
LSPDSCKHLILSDKRDIVSDRYCTKISFTAEKKSSGITLLEMMIIIAILGVLVSIATPTYIGFVERARVQSTIADLRRISLIIEKYKGDEGFFPASLNDVGCGNDFDPWGNQYQYLNTNDVLMNERNAHQPLKCNGCRWDKFERPLNTDFDLYSMGKNGVTQPKIDNNQSRDDIIRAANGGYFGQAGSY